MNDLVPPPEAAAKLDALNRPHRLVARDGGGVVFPHGFFGPGFYLPEWEYIRYCTLADHQEPHEDSLTWWQRHVLRPSMKGSITLGVGIWIAVRYLESQFEGGVQNGLLAAVALYFYWTLYRRFRDHSQRMLEAFPSAVRLPGYSNWWRHIEAASPALRTTTFLSKIIEILVLAGIGFLFSSLVAKGSLHPVVGIAIAPLLALRALYLSAILASFALLLLKFGRRPIPADLEPVDPPAARDPNA